MVNFKKSEDYASHKQANDSGDYIGALHGSDKFFLRVACNKVIHAQEVRPIYERADQYVLISEEAEKEQQDIWYLTGEIELSGEFRGTVWDAVLYTQPFIETVLGLIEFGYPVER